MKREIDPTRVCAFCREDMSTRSKYDDFCSRGCWDAYYETEYHWYDGELDLGKPRKRMYRATVSTYFGQVENFHDKQNAEIWVYNMFGGNASQGDIQRSIRINLEK